MIYGTKFVGNSTQAIYQTFPLVSKTYLEGPSRATLLKWTSRHSTGNILIPSHWYINGIFHPKSSGDPKRGFNIYLIEWGVELFRTSSNDQGLTLLVMRADRHPPFYHAQPVPQGPAISLVCYPVCVTYIVSPYV